MFQYSVYFAAPTLQNSARRGQSGHPRFGENSIFQKVTGLENWIVNAVKGEPELTVNVTGWLLYRTKHVELLSLLFSVAISTTPVARKPPHELRSQAAVSVLRWAPSYQRVSEIHIPVVYRRHW